MNVVNLAPRPRRVGLAVATAASAGDAPPALTAPGRRRRARLAVALAGLALSGCWCDGPEVSFSEWQVLAHRAPIARPGGQPVMALVRLDDDGTEYRIDPSRLGGFEAEWGTRYTLRIRSSDAPRWIDVSAYPSLSFDQVIAARPVVGEVFRLHRMGAPWLAEDGRGFVDGQRFSCRSPEVCAALDRRRADPEARFDVQLEHGPDGALELFGVEDGTCRYHADCEEPKRNWCCAGRCDAFEGVFSIDYETNEAVLRPECQRR